MEAEDNVPENLDEGIAEERSEFSEGVESSVGI